MKSNMRITMNDLDRGMLQHNKLPDLALDKLMEWIMSGKLSMGDKLNTEELASQLGVSRMPIREALANLEKKGLAESVPYAGTRLVTLTKDDVRQIYIARTALEPVAAKYACEKITDEDIQNLKEIHAEYIRIVRQEELDAIDVYQQNRLYHFSIYKISQLDRICAMIESLWDNLSFFKLIYGQKLLEGRESRERMIEEHQSYLDALKQRDSERISHLLAQNLKKRTEDIPYSLDKYIAESESDNRAWTSKPDAGLFCFARHMSVVDQRRKDGFFTLYIIGDSTQTKLCNSNLSYQSAKGSGCP